MTTAATVAATYACPAPNAPAQLIDGEIPDAPPGALNATGTVVVDVELAPDGSVRKLLVRRSSGNAALDAAAVRAARASTFAPPCKHGLAVAGRYAYTTTFGHRR